MLKKFLAVLAMMFASVAFAAVDVNKATAAELDAVKGIGPGTSKMILDERKKGDFKSWEDFIERVKGVGESRAAKLSAEGLRVGSATYKKASTAKKDEKKDDKAAKKEDKKDAKAEKKEEKKDDKAMAAAKPASAAKPAASAKK